MTNVKQPMHQLLAVANDTPESMLVIAALLPSIKAHLPYALLQLSAPPNDVVLDSVLITPVASETAARHIAPIHEKLEVRHAQHCVKS